MVIENLRRKAFNQPALIALGRSKLWLFKHSHMPQFAVPCWSSTRKQRYGARHRYGILGIQV